MSQNNISWEDVQELLPKRTTLVYIDYNDNFDNSFDLLQTCLSKCCWSGITEELDFHEQESANIKEIKKELKTDLMNKYSLSKKKAKRIIEKYEDSISEYCYDEDDSTPIEDCLKNTGRIIAHYDTGYYMEPDSWSWEDYRIRYERIMIKKFLGIKDSSLDNELDMMIRQATYGGQLLVYFNMDFNYFMTNMEKSKSIKFTSASIGIIDHYNGSGDILDGEVKEIHLPFNNNNLFLEKSIKYNWTYSIAGMCLDWADSTGVELLEEAIEGEVEDSPQIARQKQEDEYNKTYKEGSCTFGDMDIRRHRNTPYRNDFPCGNKCTSCGTFWID